MQYTTGRFYKLITIKKDFVIARFDHYQPENVVGFIVAQSEGTMVINKDELANHGIAKVIPVELVETETEFAKTAVNLINDNKVMNYAISCTLRDDTTFTSIDNKWKPTMLIGEMSCAMKMAMDSEALVRKTL